MRRQKGVLPCPSITPGSADFIWATGIEDTFISQPDRRTGRILDEYALTQHYERWEEDLQLMAALGVNAARYGIPWYRVEPRPGEFDWSWTDRVLETLVNTHGIEPIIDLVHYGAPGWLEGSFLNPDYPERVAAYARAFAERYQGLCYWYTPLNEPRVHAWFAARLGWWPPYRRTWRDFAAVLVALSRGIVLTQKAVASVEPEATFVHVDATDLYLTQEEECREETALRQNLVFGALDLVQGLVDTDHALTGWFLRHRIAAETLDWFRQNRVRPDIVGYNMYPMFSEKWVGRLSSGGIRVKIRPCGGDTFARLTRMYAERYGLPVMCTETASNGAPWKRCRWITESIAQIRSLRSDGVPVVGYTYWPLFSLVTWPYLRGKLPLARYILHLGLWNLTPDAEQPEMLRREETSAAAFYRQDIAGGINPLGGQMRKDR